jgi:hypothetical protein
MEGCTYRHTGFKKYTVAMGPGAIIYILNFMKIGSDIQTAWRYHKPVFILFNKEIRLRTAYLSSCCVKNPVSDRGTKRLNEGLWDWPLEGTRDRLMIMIPVWSGEGDVPRTLLWIFTYRPVPLVRQSESYESRFGSVMRGVRRHK